MKPDPLRRFFSLAPSDGERAGVRGDQEVNVEYEPDSELRDFALEQETEGLLHEITKGARA